MVVRERAPGVARSRRVAVRAGAFAGLDLERVQALRSYQGERGLGVVGDQCAPTGDQRDHVYVVFDRLAPTSRATRSPRSPGRWERPGRTARSGSHPLGRAAGPSRRCRLDGASTSATLTRLPRGLRAPRGPSTASSSTSPARSHDRGYGALLERLLSDSGLRAAWRRAPCTRAGYHAYLGGLLEHTVAVATLALEAAQLHPRLNSDLLICAALVHDLGKTREFTYGAAIELSDEGRLLGHIVLGQQLLEPYLAGLEGERRLALLHCVLSHHGLPQNRQFGSPEALALYRLNALDASIKGALEHGLG